jgi:hypothetical protein
MTTQESINAMQVYLERLMRMRQREKEHLSDVDFVLFISRFDPLISKVEKELERLRAEQFAVQAAVQGVMYLATCNFLNATAVVGRGNILYGGPLLSGPNVGVFECHAVVARHERTSIFPDATWREIYPACIATETISVCNFEPASALHVPFFAPPVPQLTSVQ